MLHGRNLVAVGSFAGFVADVQTNAGMPSHQLSCMAFHPHSAATALVCQLGCAS